MAIPDKSELIGSSVTESQFKLGLGSLIDGINTIKNDVDVVATNSLQVIDINDPTIKWNGAAIETSAGSVNMFSFASDRSFLQIDVSTSRKLIVSNARTDIASWKWVFRDENLNLLGYSPIGNFEIDIPTGAKWAMRTVTASGLTENSNLYVALVIESAFEIKNLKQEVTGVKSNVTSSTSQEVISYLPIQDIRAISTSASQPLEIFGYNSSDIRAFIQLNVEKFSELVVTGARTDVSEWVWVFRDKNLRLTGISSLFGNGTIPIPENTKYAFRTTRVNSLSLIENSGMQIIGNYRVKSLQQQVSDSKMSINNIVEQLFGEVVVPTWIDGFAVVTDPANSNLLAVGAGRAYIKIDVSDVTEIQVNQARNDIYAWKWVFANEADERIEITSFYGNGSLKIPTGAKWAMRTVKVDSLSLIENSGMQITLIGINSPLQKQVESTSLALNYLYGEVKKVMTEEFNAFQCIDPNHFIGGNQTDRIKNAVAYVKKRGHGVIKISTDVLITPNTNEWVVNEAILLPDNCWIFVDNATIRLADGVFDNLFRNEGIILNSDPYQPALKLNENRNIRIFGNTKSAAFLKAPNTPKTAPHPINGGEPIPWVGDDFGWRSFLILFANVKDYKIHDLNISQTVNWAISQEHGCEDFEIYNLTFNTIGPNGDGVDVRMGCKNGRIYNIDGFTQDDKVALTAIKNFITQHPSGSYIYPLQVGGYADRGFGANIEGVRVFNISGSGNHNCVRLLASGGSKIKNITVDNIDDDATNGYGGAVLYVSSGYGSQATIGDFDNIHANGVKSLASNTSLFIQGPILDSQFNFIRQYNPTGVLTNTSQATLENTTISNSAMGQL